MSQGEVYIDNKQGEKIDPATEENQALLVNELVESTAKNSLDFGTESLTLTAGAVALTAKDQQCRTAYVSASAAIFVGNVADGPATAASFYIVKDIVVEIPVRNTNKLSLFSAAGATVYILWRD